jgi:hypothetical protein
MIYVLFVILLLTGGLQGLPSGNLVVNGDARAGTSGWHTTGGGVATVEEFLGVPCFVVRNQGSFQQIIPMPPGAAGKYAALVARGQSERINGLDGSITGLPYLYAMPATEPPSRFLGHWQGQQLLARPKDPGEWVVMSGIFLVPEGTRNLLLDLNQAERKDSPQDGSAARFADVQVRLFATEAAARVFVGEYSRR